MKRRPRGKALVIAAGGHVSVILFKAPRVERRRFPIRRAIHSAIYPVPLGR